MNFTASLHARRYPVMIVVGWTLALTSSFALRKSSAAMITTDVVPSPTSLSCFCARSTNIFPAGCSTAKRERMVAPSFEIVTSYGGIKQSAFVDRAKWERRTPILSTSILSNPKGPNELFTMFAIDCAAMTRILKLGTHNWNSNASETYRFDHECPDRTRDRLPRRHQHEHRVDTLLYEG